MQWYTGGAAEGAGDCFVSKVVYSICRVKCLRHCLGPTCSTELGYLPRGPLFLHWRFFSVLQVRSTTCSEATCLKPHAFTCFMCRASFTSGVSQYYDANDGLSPHWLQQGDPFSGSGAIDSPRAAPPEIDSSYNGPSLTADTLARAAAADREAALDGVLLHPKSRLATVGKAEGLATQGGAGGAAVGQAEGGASVPVLNKGSAEGLATQGGAGGGAAVAQADGGASVLVLNRGSAGLPPRHSTDSAGAAAALAAAAAAAAAGGVGAAAAVRGGASGAGSGAATPRAESATGAVESTRPSGAATPVRGFPVSEGDSVVPPSPAATHAATMGSVVGSAAGLSDHGSFCSNGKPVGGRPVVGLEPLSAVDEPGDGKQPLCGCRCVIS